jgi:hypothetical protein
MQYIRISSASALGAAGPGGVVWFTRLGWHEATILLRVDLQLINLATRTRSKQTRPRVKIVGAASMVSIEDTLSYKRAIAGEHLKVYTESEMQLLT